MYKIILVCSLLILSACNKGPSTLSSDKSSELKDDDALLSWVPPFNRVNGEKLELSEIDGYVIRHRFEGEIKEYNVKYPEDSYKIEYLENGIHYFSVTVIDNENNISEPSNEVSKKIQ